MVAPYVLKLPHVARFQQTHPSTRVNYVSNELLLAAGGHFVKKCSFGERGEKKAYRCMPVPSY